MSKKSNDHDKNNFDKNANVEDQNEKRLDQLVNLVDKHTRTERHLEQHSDIASPEAVIHSLEIQKEREDEINNLKNIVAHGKHVNVDEVKNLMRNYEYTDNYLDNNADRIDDKTFKSTVEKQENRSEHLNNMDK
jgi:predicted transcriptional regulator